ncbi:hypothetical protein GNF10_09730 [Nostoc sp. UCD121]|jgi:hypothetical protein|uniref:hypothetical protein n=1 Tax=unclassified Nostoc TaxID=2593658 RepID=UPI001625BDA6|nr:MULTISPECIES: hypothetical protein [unclassified Nostoc]MBC1225282.1 hypothetical protein [Nostoc sp. UCD120]MBC1276262.1 hypothetical protein [Nostoc sp. UCD121]MBC1294959.1 hypothetical protein [Nostoc sp. UCD122]
MSRPQLNIKFDGEGEKELLETVKTRAQDERISLKEFVLDALKNRLTVPQSTQSTQPKPAVTKSEVDELKRRIVEIQISLMGEVRKDRKQIAALAEAIALIESRLDVLDPPNIVIVEEDSQARQSRQRETWENDAVEFLDAISWGDDNG